MASNLDLQEQEQLDELKAFWKQHGNLITWALTLVLAGFAAWNGWNWWQAKQAVGASAMFDELEQAATVGDADRATRVLADLKDRFAGTTYAAQGGLLAAKTQADKGQVDAALGTLTWVADKASDEAYQDLARVRLASLLIDQGRPDEALKQLEQVKSAEFAGLAQDRRGDALLTQKKPDEAITAWQAAWKALPEQQEYRRVVEAKLNALGQAPAAASGVKP